MKLSSKFIKANEMLCDLEHHVPAPYFRKSFMLDFTPLKAEVTICGLGLYELYINGKNITKGPLAPYFSNTDDICYYDNYDISGLLDEGENVIGILLGNGLRNPFGGFVWDFDQATHRGAVTVALCLEASDGENVYELEADESFRTHPSPITFDDLRMGCRYDARLEIPRWCERGFDDISWSYAMAEKTPKGKQKLCSAEPIVCTEELKPVEIKHYDRLPFGYKNTAPGAEALEESYRENVYVYDFGVNTAGVTALHIHGKPGQKITIRHGEHLIDGKFSVNTTIFNQPSYIERYLKYGQTDVYICKGGEECFVPKFKYDGFRYAYVEGLEPKQATMEALTVLVMNSDVCSRAGFVCSDDTLNQLQIMARRSDLSNFYYFPTDCPHREKNGWTGDAVVSAEHMLLNLSVENSLREWLDNIRMSQRADGRLPGIVPTGTWGFKMDCGPIWDGVCVVLPYYIYKYTGNKDIIKENAAMIMRYLFYMTTKRDERGLVAFGLGDWIDPNEEKDGKVASPLEFTCSAGCYDIASKAGFLFEEIDCMAEKNYAFALAEEFRSAIRIHLIDPQTKVVAGECQTSQAMAMEVGLFDRNELEEAGKRLVEIIHRDGDINACGMIGLRYIFHALTRLGQTNLAYKIITCRHPHCYGYWVENGATTMRESFKSLEHPAMDSQNHHFLGDVSSWMIQELAGIKPNPQANDTAEFEISPHFVEDLTYAEGYYDSMYGRIYSRWERVAVGIRLMIEIPSGMWGNVVMEDGWQFVDGRRQIEISEGKYYLEICLQLPETKVVSNDL